jgi:hypothetical protein
MSKLAIWAEVEANPGKEQTVAEFLKSTQALAEKEQRTLTWYAVKLGERNLEFSTRLRVRRGEKLT